MEEEASVEVRRRRPVKRLTALVLLALILLALLVAWTQRRPIASDYIERELARRNVRATYEVQRIGFRTQRLENLVIGDPRNPDLTARWVEVKLSWSGLSRPKVKLITARGVRLNARLARNGKISFGEIDRLLPPPTGLPFRFPDQDVDIADAGIRFDTPAGRVGIALEGKGNLANGFRGRMAAAAHRLRPGSCGLDGVKGLWTVAIRDLRPSFRGPAQAARLACGDRLAVSGIGLDLDVGLAPALDRWKGSTALRAARLRAGSTLLTGLGGRLGLDGDSKMTRGTLDLASAAARIGSVSAARASVEGRYGLSLDNGGFTLLGNATARGASARPAVAGAVATLGSAGGTPLEPVGDALAAALSRAAGGFDAHADLRLVNGRGFGGVRFERLSASTRSGARVELGGGQGLTYYWPAGLTRLDGDLAVSGGGFPQIRLSLSQPRPGAPIRGTGRSTMAGCAGWCFPSPAGSTAEAASPSGRAALGRGSNRSRPERFASAGPCSRFARPAGRSSGRLPAAGSWGAPSCAPPASPERSGPRRSASPGAGFASASPDRPSPPPTSRCASPPTASPSARSPGISAKGG